MPSKRSGGARAVEKKHLERNAKRPEGYNERSIAAYRRLRRAPKTAAGAVDEAVAFLRLTMREASTDPGLPPEQRREQVARIAAQLVKAADPKRLVDDLGAELREAYNVIVGLKESRGAAQEPARDPEGPPLPAQH